MAAGDLKAGDEVYNLDGSTAIVIDSELEKLDESVLVYNLEVEDFHTYFVGYEPVLVHNSCASSRENWGPEHGKNNSKHNNAIEDELDWAYNNGATDIRKNQPQVDADGERVFSDTGNYNKPDASYNLGGNRYNTNYVSNPNNIREVNREINAFNSIVQNDPNAFSSLVFKY